MIATRDGAAAAWRGVVAPVPGLTDRRPSRRQGSAWLVGGGCGFWLVLGPLIMIAWSVRALLIFGAILLVVSLRLLNALGVTLAWAVAEAWRRWARRTR